MGKGLEPSGPYRNSENSKANRIETGRPPDPAPTPLIYWGDLSVTGNGDLPLATQRRVESIAF
jgi:hypothetical protein